MKKMFKFKYLLFLVLFSLVSTTSCKKEVFEPPSVPGYGGFVLNDSINTPMGVYVTKNS